MYKLSLVPLALLTTALATSSIQAQTLKAYGSATKGTGGKEPVLWALSTPRPGNANFGVSIENGKAGAGAVAFFSQKSANAKLGGVSILIDFAASIQLPFVTLDKNGEASYKLPIPNIAGLIGTTSYTQAFIADNGGAPLGFSATHGLEGTIQRYGLLIGTRSSSGSSDKQIAVNLDTGKLTTVSTSNLNNANIPGFSRTSTHCLIPGGLTKNVTLWDCRAFPPKYVRSFAAQSIPWAVTYHPDGLRAYVVNQNSTKGTAPVVQVVWGVPGATNFGTAFPGGSIPLGKYVDSWQMEFVSDGTVGVMGTLGFVSPGPELRKYDTKTSSKTYHKLLGTYKFPVGDYCWGFCRVTDNIFAGASASLGGQVQVNLVDIRTMRAVKGIGRAQFGVVIWNITGGPRGKYVYVANVPNTAKKVPAGFVRINADSTDANYGKTVSVTAGFSSNWSCYDVAVSPAGDRIYAIGGIGFNAAFKGSIIEYDGRTLKKLRTFDATGLGNLYNLAIR